MKYEDADIVEALLALEKQLPDGYFNDFSRKVAARLEDGMERTDLVDQGWGSGDVGGALLSQTASEPKSEAVRDENSGLHEIKELATDAKKRISARVSSQSDADDDLLGVASSGAFKVVVLPDPGKQPARDADASAHAQAIPAREPARGARKRRTPAIVAGLGVVAVAAGALYVVTRQGRQEKMGDGGADSSRSAEISTPSSPAPASEPSAAPAPPAPDEAERSPEGAAVAMPMQDTAAEQTAAAGDAPADDPASARSGAEANKRDDRRASRSAESPAERARPRKPAASADTAKPVARSAGNPAAGTGTLDDLLDDVTGGVDEKKAKKEVAADRAAPRKQGLDRSDVARAMGAVSDQAKACHDKEDAVGSVNIRFTVDPGGRVTKASATGKFAGTPTGDCVAAAVKRASFPSWDGGPMSFTFPFLLTQ